MANVFSLAGQGLKLTSREDVEKHIQPLVDSEDVTHIDLSGNTLGIGACEALGAVLKTKSKLESADLHDIFTSRSLQEIPVALESLLTALLNCTKLQTIDLSDNAFGFMTKEPLVAFLAKHVPLKHLILNNNGMGPDAGISIAEALSELATRKSAARQTGSKVPDLESVVCGRNRLETGSMSAWAKAYQAHSVGMKSVKMTQNGIRPDGIVCLLQAGLSHCKKLEVLDMQDNTFTYKGAAALAAAVSGWSQLRELGVGDDLLSSRGAVKVFDEMSNGHNKQLEIMRLQYNEIKPPAVKALLDAAASALPALRRIELNGNKFEEDDPTIEELATLLSDRKDKHGKEDDPEDHWGLDELDELEGEDSDEEDEVEADEEDEEAHEKILKDADTAENEKVSQKKDTDVDELADVLARTKV